MPMRHAPRQDPTGPNLPCRSIGPRAHGLRHAYGSTPRGGWRDRIGVGARRDVHGSRGRFAYSDIDASGQRRECRGASHRTHRAPEGFGTACATTERNAAEGLRGPAWYPPMIPLLTGLRVVECASFIAAPSCALHLRQLGADVIRIDPIGGGPDFHRWPLSPEGKSFYWEGLNKGKKSIAIDFSRPEGRKLVVDLATAGGILVTNFPRDGFLAHERLQRLRTDMISVRVMGWRDGGSGVDYTINAGIGVPFMTGEARTEDAPVNHVLPAWDLITGAYAAFVTLAAERERLKTGRGCDAAIPLSDVALAALANMGQVAEVLTRGDRPRVGNALFGAFGRDFRTADGERVMVVAITRRQWSGLITALQLESSIAEIESRLGVSFAREEGLRFEHREALFPVFERSIASLSLEQLQRVFEANEVCWSPYRTLSRALQEDPRLSLTSPWFDEIEHPSGLRYPAAGPAVTIAGADRLVETRSPRLGEHTDEVLGELLSLSPETIAHLHREGLVAGPVGDSRPSVPA